jgi:hypothetical protein
MDKIILDLCGGTGSWSKPYKDAGYDVFNITLPDRDVREFTLEHLNHWYHNKEFDYTRSKRVYGIFAAPPCTMFSFCRTNAKNKRDLAGAMEIVFGCLRIIAEAQYQIKKDTQKFSPLKFWALENPARGMLKWFLGKPAFTFQPYEFGDNYKKETALWGIFNEPKKNPIVCSKPKFDSLSTKEIHGEFYGKYDRTTRRSITPAGFAKAFFEANK